MITLKGFSDYRLKIETMEVFSEKDGESVKLERTKDSKTISWYLYDNGVKTRKSLWDLFLENRDEIMEYCNRKSGRIS